MYMHIYFHLNRSLVLIMLVLHSLLHGISWIATAIRYLPIFSYVNTHISHSDQRANERERKKRTGGRTDGVRARVYVYLERVPCICGEY